VFNGKTKILDDRPITSIQCDACTEGGGATFLGDYMYINWNIDMPDMAPLHINVKEAIMIILAIFRWATYFFYRTKKSSSILII